tara:strand:- start:2974 stop:3384 length:411 start_codon:yes stop_codon:yes gene_type:complete
MGGLQCLCGSIHYKITAEPLLTAVCHCTHCQKATGSAYSINIGVPANGFHVDGDTLSTYVDKGDSGQDLRRYFCNNCGSPIYTEADVMPGISIVKAGTLDDTSSFTPGINIFCQSKMAWLNDNGETVDFEQMPPAG